MKTAGKPWKESASRRISNPFRLGGSLISQCFNSERSLLSSRPWLPKINYTDALLYINIAFQNVINTIFDTSFVWVTPGSLNVLSPLVVVSQRIATTSRCPTRFSHLGENWQEIKEKVIRSSKGKVIVIRHLRFPTGITCGLNIILIIFW